MVGGDRRSLLCERPSLAIKDGVGPLEQFERGLRARPAARRSRWGRLQWRPIAAEALVPQGRRPQPAETLRASLRRAEDPAPDRGLGDSRARLSAGRHQECRQLRLVQAVAAPLSADVSAMDTWASASPGGRGPCRRGRLRRRWAPSTAASGRPPGTKAAWVPSVPTTGGLPIQPPRERCRWRRRRGLAAVSVTSGTGTWAPGARPCGASPTTAGGCRRRCRRCRGRRGATRRRSRRTT